MNLTIYKKFNEYYLPREVFEDFVNECKKTKNVLYGFDVFKKLKKGEMTVEIVDFLVNLIAPKLHFNSITSQFLS